MRHEASVVSHFFAEFFPPVTDVKLARSTVFSPKT